ncbi:MAG TPA: radical SAM family heme chaperone HemW [Bacteroidia bacterium]|nr:radical SAM family heme chaperone HemW [Bacteroidia bacterium]
MAGIYFHIPYCRKACHYCDFHFSVNQKNKGELMQSMIEELRIQRNFFSVLDKSTPIETIYFGGGTPSLSSKKELSDLIETVYTIFPVSNNPEITIECNPDDLSSDYCNDLFALGFNRASIGIQSFDDHFLSVLNRSHNAQKAFESIDNIVHAGINNVSIDLMYGLPEQSNDHWLKQLAQVRDLPIQYLSCYNLTIESNTVFGKRVKQKLMQEPDDEVAGKQFEQLMEWADENSFEHYEISNLAKAGFQSQHNSAYWLNKPYLGIGPSAHSYNTVHRFHNFSSNARYVQQLNNKQQWYEIEELDHADKVNDYLLTSLRANWGIDLNYVEDTYGAKEKDRILTILKTIDHEHYHISSDAKVTLSKKGKLWSDRIALEIFLDHEY